MNKKCIEPVRGLVVRAKATLMLLNEFMFCYVIYNYLTYIKVLPHFEPYTSLHSAVLLRFRV